ncbi:hypothetical protein [Scytonema sp. PRP1]|uniref:hypothetical protein n=1 Tax=Scytonema sp. PRP1 TaxID=3120513 RepID=UPI000BBC638C
MVASAWEYVTAGGLAPSRVEAAIDGISFSLQSPPACYTLCYKRIYELEVVGEIFCFDRVL